MKKKIKHILKRSERVLVAITVIAFLCMAAVYVISYINDAEDTKHLVTFYDRGTKRIVLTRADTVQGALKAADIKINPEDKVEPTTNSRLTSSDTDVIIYRSRLVAIHDGNTRQSVVTVAQSPNAVAGAAKLEPINAQDKATFSKGDIINDSSPLLLTIERVKPQEPEPEAPRPVAFTPRPDALTVSKGAQVFVDSQGVAHRETYYDLPMNIVIKACGAGGTYSIRSDGAKVDQDGYVLVAASLSSYPRCSVVETSLGPAKVYDTGGFALRHPYGFDLATDWTNYNGQ